MAATSFAGKVVLVTGGSSGIGRAAAVAFGLSGARVAIASRRRDAGEDAVRQVRQTGAEAIFVPTDVIRSTEVERLMERVLSAWGRLDCAFNNAGITGEMARTADCTEENWNRTISVNLTAVWYSMKWEIRQMLRQGAGAIVNNASTAGLVGMRGGPAYSASKGGVIQLTRTAALEYARSGIRVNAVCPGFIETPMTEAHAAVNPDLEPWIRKIQPMGRLGTAEEVAEAVLWLCSDAASFVTGHALVIDGGMVAQ